MLVKCSAWRYIDLAGLHAMDTEHWQQWSRTTARPYLL